MNDRSSGASLAAALGGVLALGVALSAAIPASAEPASQAIPPTVSGPARIGLVIGNGEYAAFPPLPACLTASRDLADTLSGLGYRVILRQNLTSGGMAAALDAFAKGMEASPGASVFAYVCGYAAGMNDRPFLLPVSATIRRPSDVMTQGLLAKAMVDLMIRGQPSRGVLAFDLVPANGVPAPLLDGLGALPAPDGLGLIAVSAPAPATGPTALSGALRSGLAVPEVASADLLVTARGQLEASPGTAIAALRQPLVSRPLAMDETPPAPEPTRSAPVPTERMAVLPEEGAMTDGDRRRVQEALARLGYYAAPVDGRFGPETRAAIRRFQHELGAAMTGTITGEQAARLVERP